MELLGVRTGQGRISVESELVGRAARASWHVLREWVPVWVPFRDLARAVNRLTDEVEATRTFGRKRTE